jgi:hypothetical protein
MELKSRPLMLGRVEQMLVAPMTVRMDERTMDEKIG